MIGTPELYKLYKECQKLKVIEEIKKVKFLHKEKEIIINHYKNYIALYSQYTGIDYYYMYNDLEMPEFKTKFTIGLMKDTLVKVKECFETLVKINIEIKSLQEKIEVHHNNKITLKIYSDIIRMFSQAMIEEIVKGYILRLGCIGQIQVVRKQRKGKNVNWNASMRLKEHLLNDGVEILKHDIDDNLNVINNGGEPYLIYYTSDEAYWLIWDRSRQTFFNKEDYPLYPFYNLLFTKGEDDKGSIMRLVRTWQQDKFAHLRYAKR